MCKSETSSRYQFSLIELYLWKEIKFVIFLVSYFQCLGYVGILVSLTLGGDEEMEKYYGIFRR